MINSNESPFMDFRKSSFFSHKLPGRWVHQSILLGDPFQGFKKKDWQATEHLGLYPQLPLAGLKTS